MKIEVIRDIFRPNETLGKLFIDGSFFCYTLEDTVRDVKIKHHTAIPAGIYKAVLAFSQKFKKFMLRLLNVPNFDGVLFHGGNTNKDSSGCILVAFHRNEEKGYIWSSASQALHDLAKKETGDIIVEIINNKVGYNA